MCNCIPANVDYAVIAIISEIMEKKFIRKPLIIRSPETVGSVNVVRWYVGFVIPTVDITEFFCTGKNIAAQVQQQ